MRAVPGLSIVCVVTNRQWIGSPCSGAVVSRMSRRVKETGHRQIRCRAILRLTHLDTSMAKGEFRTARLAAWRCRDRNDEASLFRQVVGKGKQRGVLVCRRLDPAVLRDPREQMNASWSPGKLLVDVAFPIG